MKNSPAWWALLGMALVLTASTAALADPTTLICDENGTAGTYTYDGSIIVDLNEAQHSIVIHYPGVTGTTPVYHHDGRSVGPLPAIFDANNIAVSLPWGVGITINRVTGEGVLRTSDGLTMAERWNCHVGAKQF